MSPGFFVPLFCLVFIAVYGFSWRHLNGNPVDENP